MGHARENMTLLPTWLQVLWIVALAVVVVLHLRHAAHMSGRVRLWHCMHIAMAVGMIVMYATMQDETAQLQRAGVAVFAVLTLCALVVVGTGLRGSGRICWPWLATTAGLMIMVYMFLPLADQPAGLSYAVVAYLVAELLAWLFAPAVSSLGGRRADMAATGPAGDTGSGRPADGDVLVRARPVARATVAPDVADLTVGVRATLAVMSASMAWMLIVTQHMQAGMPGMHM